MNRKRRKLVADFGGTHLRIGFSYEKKIENLSKVRYDKKLSPLELILDYISENSFSFDINMGVFGFGTYLKSFLGWFCTCLS